MSKIIKEINGVDKVRWEAEKADHTRVRIPATPPNKKIKEILAQRYQEIKLKSASRKRTEKEMFDDDKVWEEH